ncbi:hypothetical protein OROGR_021441 [Orobanche gracilis]
MQIPISINSSLDVRRWFFSRSGHYSVKTAYYIARDLKKRKSAPATSSSTPPSRNWSFVWQFDVPNKLKVFLWRLLRNGLPVMQNLGRRNINVDNICPLCRLPGETVMHTFQLCHFARVIWAISNLPSLAIYHTCSDAWEWVLHVKHVLDADQFHFFICICWRLWYTRNELVNNMKQPEPSAVMQFAGDFLMRYREAKSQFAAPRPPESQKVWTPPMDATIKVNVDAALFKNSNSTGLGLVARNSSGIVVAWRQRLRSNVTCPEIAETLALLEAVRLAEEFGWQQVTIESDCLNVIKAINSQEVCLSSVGHMIDEIKSVFLLFSVISFQHTFRSANILAHDLAKHVVGNADGTQLPLSFASDVS